MANDFGNFVLGLFCETREVAYSPRIDERISHGHYGCFGIFPCAWIFNQRAGKVRKRLRSSIRYVSKSAESIVTHQS